MNVQNSTQFTEERLKTTCIDLPYSVVCVYLQTLLSGSVPHPFGLTVHDDFVYWTDWVTKKIEKANKLDGSQRQTLVKDLGDLMDIEIFYRGRPTGVKGVEVWVKLLKKTDQPRFTKTLPKSSAFSVEIKFIFTSSFVELMFGQ